MAFFIRCILDQHACIRSDDTNLHLYLGMNKNYVQNEVKYAYLLGTTVMFPDKETVVDTHFALSFIFTFYKIRKKDEYKRRRRNKNVKINVIQG